MRSFNEWWKIIPSDLAPEARKDDEESKPSLHQVNRTLLQLHLSGKMVRNQAMKN